jgi:hypothetical protein
MSSTLRDEREGRYTVELNEIMSFKDEISED